MTQPRLKVPIHVQRAINDRWGWYTYFRINLWGGFEPEEWYLAQNSIRNLEAYNDPARSADVALADDLNRLLDYLGWLRGGEEIGALSKLQARDLLCLDWIDLERSLANIYDTCRIELRALLANRANDGKLLIEASFNLDTGKIFAHMAIDDFPDL